MEPRIQYAQTKDGVGIAFWTLGKGMPLVLTPAIPFNHIQLAWRVPDERRLFERLAQSGKLVHYDSRGSGSSERNVADYSIESLILDLEAVIHSLGLEKFALFGRLNSGPVAITYAARHPERVSRLILQSAYARGSGWRETPQLKGLMGLIDKDWELFVQATAHYVYGWSEGEPARRYAELARESCTPEEATAAFQAFREFDVADLLSEVRSSTLVLHDRRISWPEVDLSRGLASKIPGARLALGDGTEALLNAVDEFLAEGEEAAAPGLAADDVHTILFTDVEGSTALTQRLGDARAREVLREHERIVREALKSHGGSEVKTMGDGFMASFSSATKALECAIAMQRAFAEHNQSAEEPIRVRIGLNAGEPIAEEEDLFGTAVNLAARICGHAEAGQILAPIVVRELAAGKQFLLADLGETALRGFEDPVRLYEVSWQEA